MAGRVQDKVTIITGAGEGLGRVMALLFSREGAPVVLAARRPHLIEETAELVEADGGTALVVPTDVTDEEACARLVATTVERFGRVDVLLNNASYPGVDLHIWDQTLENWNATIAAVVTGPMLLTREVLRQSMLERRSGSIVNFSSTASLQGMPRKSHYSVAKSGLRLLTKVAAQEAGPHGVRVNCVVPGGIQTDLLFRYWDRIAGERGVTAEVIRDESAAGAALRKIALPEETAMAALFLASDESSAITGQSLVVDSGVHMVG
jgi:NAD(P)-dependent dehydrogenase (short-subunit alcohol dehydrogenase family)